MTSIINTISQKLTCYFLTATKYFYFLSNSNHSFFVPFISIKRQTKTQTLNPYTLSVICKSSVTSTILIICEISIILNLSTSFLTIIIILLLQQKIEEKGKKTKINQNTKPYKQTTINVYPLQKVCNRHS